jgi:hypothetical protein
MGLGTGTCLVATLVSGCLLYSDIQKTDGSEFTRTCLSLDRTPLRRVGVLFSLIPLLDGGREAGSSLGLNCGRRRTAARHLNRPDPTMPARTPEEKQESVPIDHTPPKAETDADSVYIEPTNRARGSCSDASGARDGRVNASSSVIQFSGTSCHNYRSASSGTGGAGTA